MRGERVNNNILTTGFDGSSPHARGTRVGEAAGVVHERFIPACAGNAKVKPQPKRNPAVHPRMRGERLPEIKEYLGDDGSSPHARGTLVQD